MGPCPVRQELRLLRTREAPPLEEKVREGRRSLVGAGRWVPVLRGQRRRVGVRPAGPESEVGPGRRASGVNLTGVVLGGEPAVGRVCRGAGGRSSVRTAAPCSGSGGSCRLRRPLRAPWGRPRCRGRCGGRSPGPGSPVQAPPPVRAGLAPWCHLSSVLGAVVSGARASPLLAATRWEVFGCFRGGSTWIAF